MPHDYNNTDKNLRQLENQSLPDLSRMDDHWQAMKKELVPATAPGAGKGLWRNPWSWLIAACVIGLLVMIFYRQTSHTNNIPAAIAELQQPTDTLPRNLLKYDSPIKLKPQRIILPRYKIILTRNADTVTRAFFVPDTSLEKPLPVVSNSVALESFFQQLQKPAQAFTIDNTKDTVITGNEGTTLFIPALAFANDTATVLLSEFYSYQDIITHRLSTTSNGIPLISGGMLHIQAFVQDKEIKMTSKKIVIKMPAKQFDDSMQLFLPAPVTTKYDYLNNEGGDTTSPVMNAASINWMPAGQQQSWGNGRRFIKVLNLMDHHYETDGTTVKYFIANSCPLTNQQVKDELQKRYGRYYGDIKVRRIRRDQKKFFLSSATHPVVGDSITEEFNIALKYKLITAKDSARYMRSWGIDSIRQTSVTSFEKKYNFSIRTLGWINCDRFYNDRRAKISYYVDLQQDASNYQTMLVFDSMKSMMQGYIEGNKVVFANLPEGETAKVICIGIQNGKPVAAMKDVRISASPLTGLKFEETSPDQFREQLAVDSWQ